MSTTAAATAVAAQVEHWQPPNNGITNIVCNTTLKLAVLVCLLSAGYMWHNICRNSSGFQILADFGTNQSCP
jgi:hypothetical protein